MLKILLQSSSPSWELRTASPRDRYGGTPSAWLVSEDTYVKTPSVGRRQPMTSLPAWPQYKGRRENTSSSSSSALTGLFEETCILVGIQFSFIIMASTSKAFNKCVDPCPRYLRWHTHNLCVFCLGKEHARDVLEGKICVQLAQLLQAGVTWLER